MGSALCSRRDVRPEQYGMDTATESTQLQAVGISGFDHVSVVLSMNSKFDLHEVKDDETNNEETTCRVAARIGQDG